MLELGQQDTEKGLEEWNKTPKTRAQKGNILSALTIRSDAGRLRSDGSGNYGDPIGCNASVRMVVLHAFLMFSFLA